MYKPTVNVYWSFRSPYSYLAAEVAGLLFGATQGWDQAELQKQA